LAGEEYCVRKNYARCGVVYTTLKYSADGLILETKFVDHGNAAVWRIVGWVGYGSGFHLLTYR
jgi:hypothetical protein